MRVFILLIITCVLAACAILPLPEPELTAPTSKIFTAEEAEAKRLAVFSGWVDVEAYWTITPDDVENLQTRLINYLEAEGHTAILEKYDAYYQQYFGYMMDGEQLIYSNFFCDTFDMDWRENFVGVDDGGDCFFQVIYHPAQDEISALYINGES